MKKRLMVVDDSRMILLQLRRLLDGTDYEVAAYCENGEDAIASYDEVRPDLVTMDVIMPGIDGLETAQVLLDEHPQARIVMLSSLDCEDVLQEAGSIGAKGMVCKPLDRDDLLESLAQALA